MLTKNIKMNVLILTFLMIFKVFASEPTFSVKHGFFKDIFDLYISAQNPNDSIRYTLDCSDPLTSKTAISVLSPAIININPASTLDRAKTPCVCVRAAAFGNDNYTTPSVTQTYIFTDNVINQSIDGSRPGRDWPSPNANNSSSQLIDYGMDLSITASARYKNDMETALLDIPSISIVTDLENLFDAKTGIYTNAALHGADWERPTSVELVHPDGSPGFQINAGLRIRGGWSRHNDNPKHAFRLFFRAEYGETKLRYPLFGDEGIQEFDNLDLRTSQNYSWSYKSSEGQFNTMNRDVYSRDIQRDMGQLYTRSRYYHLYLNGMYWGLFQSQERPEASFASSYMGGKREDYDVVKVDIGDAFNIYELEATDGDLNAWQELWESCTKGFYQNANFFRLLGKRWNGEDDPSMKVLLDIDNFIDYMIIIFFTGNFDAPVSKFRSNKDPNNFYAIYNRNGTEGFKFLAHDAEHTLLTVAVGPCIGLEENRINIGDIDGQYRMQVTKFEKFHPQWLHFLLCKNAEYRIAFADRVYKHFYNHGLLTPAEAAKRFESRAKEIDMAIIAESARWGDSKSYFPRTKYDDWLPAVNDILYNYFPARTQIVLDQLRDAGLVSEMEAPIFYSDKVVQDSIIKVEKGHKITLTNPNLNYGSILYTIDGSDPRKIGGMVSDAVQEGEGDVILDITKTIVLKSRCHSEGKWSALHQLRIVVPDIKTGLKVTEIHYHPLAEGATDEKEYEFLEIKNISVEKIELDSAYFTTGIKYVFPPSTKISPNNFIVLASNADAFFQRYQFYPHGEFEGQLDNAGELLTLVDKNGQGLFSFVYDSKYPWPASPDGNGYSLVSDKIEPVSEQSRPEQWRASAQIHGSPGKNDPASQQNFASADQKESTQLYQNFPNPFRSRTTIRFSHNLNSSIQLKIYNIRGQLVATLLDTELSPGQYSVEWNALEHPPGVYFYRLVWDKGSLIKKCLAVK